jgi:hypothetical protein
VLLSATLQRREREARPHRPEGDAAVLSEAGSLAILDECLKQKSRPQAAFRNLNRYPVTASNCAWSKSTFE